MQSHFRNKVFLISGATVVAMLLMILVGVLTGRHTADEIQDIESRSVPMLELGPKVETQFDRIGRTLQDAVAAQDKDALGEAATAKAKLLDLLAHAPQLMSPADAHAVNTAVEEYYAAAVAVSTRLISGETGEEIVDAIAGMQAAQRRAELELRRTTAFDRARLNAGFEAVREAHRRAEWSRLSIAVACAVLVVALSLWVTKSVLSSLAELSAGFARFGEGDFSRPMRVLANDELGEAAKSANRMAEKLHDLDWMKTGQATLAHEIQSALEVEDLASSIARFLMKYLESEAVAVYIAAEEGRLELAQKNASTSGFDQSRALPLEHGVALASAGAKPTLIVPVLHAGEVSSVIELRFHAPPASMVSEFLTTVRENIAVALAAARSHSARRELLVELEKTNQELKDQTAELDSFSYSVSHDLRGPLRAIDGFSRMLLEDYGPTLDAEAQRLLTVVRKNTQRMGNLIDDLLEFSRLGRQALHFESVDMNALAKSAYDEAVAAEPNRSIDLKLQELPPVRGDSALLKQVWVNLLANAVKYSRTREVATIAVESAIVGSEQRYSVRDNGVGFDMKYLDKLFGVFQRLHAGSSFEGTGVGLALVHRIVKKHGGRVWAEGQVDKGAVFSFALPIGGASHAD